MLNLKIIFTFTITFCGTILLFHLLYLTGYESILTGYAAKNDVDYSKFIKQTPSSRKNKTIFCYISSAPEHLETRAIAVNNTWARLCDKYFFITSIYHSKNNVLFTNRTFEIYDLLPLLQVAGMKIEDHDLITDKVYGAYKHIYAKYPDYDWYMKADDDTFVFMDNLKSFLSRQDSQGNFTFGYNFKVGVPGGYHSGGAGIAIGNRALKAIGAALTQNDSNCINTGIDDKDLNECLRKLGFQMGNSTDEKGRERFHPLESIDFLTNWFPDWLFEFAVNPVKAGAECCSNETTTFHYVSPQQMYLYHNLWLKYKEEKGVPFNFTELIVEYQNKSRELFG